MRCLQFLRNTRNNYVFYGYGMYSKPNNKVKRPHYLSCFSLCIDTGSQKFYKCKIPSKPYTITKTKDLYC